MTMMHFVLNSSNYTRTRADLLAQPEMYSGDRDLNLAYGYPSEPTVSDYCWMYNRFGVATRVVDIFPDECWKVRPSVKDTADAEDSAFEAAVKEVIERVDAWDVLNHADRVAGIFEYAVVYLGFDDVGDSIDGLARPVERGDILFAQVYDQEFVSVDTWDTNPTSARYGAPETYSIQFGQPGSEGGSTTTKVHWTRVLHIADKTGSNRYQGRPRMRNVYNRLLDMRKILGASGEMFWQGGRNGIVFSVDAAADLDSDALTAMKAQLEDYTNGLQRYIAAQGASATSLGVSVPDPTNSAAAQYQFIATSLGIPLRIFLGSEQAQLASSQDTGNWNSRLSLRQETLITPRQINPFVDTLIKVGAVPSPRGGRYWVEWPDLDTVNEQERADVAKAQAEALNTYASGNASMVMGQETFLAHVMGYDDEMIQANDAELGGLADAGSDDGEEDEA